MLQDAQRLRTMSETRAQWTMQSSRSACARAGDASAGQADSQPMASDTSTANAFSTCKRVLPCVSMCGGGESHTRGACVSSVFWTRERVCKAQRGERGRGGGEAEASEARCAPVRWSALFCAVEWPFALQK